MENILLPTTVQFSDTDVKHIGELLITPCHQGYGTTLGNALRRVLLSSLSGAAVEFVKIDGVQHEFSGIEGVQEDMIEVILNLKQMVVISHADGPVTLTLSKKGKGDLTAGDFEKNSDVEVINPDMKIMTVTDDKKTINMEIVIGTGRGYITVAEKETKNVDLGMIAIDSLYSPIRDVGYKVENTRVGDVTDYEKLVLTINTDGSLSAKQAVMQSAKILMDHLELVLEAKDTEESTAKVKKEEKVEEPVKIEEETENKE